jgi:hypothetical protein
VLIAVGSAYTIHVMNRITESAAKDPLVAIKTGLAYVIIPVFLAALTTMAGFLSFIAGSYLRMIQFFGVFTAMGVLFALLLSVTFIPALMAVSSKKRIDGNHTAESRSRWLNGFLDWIRKSVTSHRRTVLLTWMLLITAGIVGACLVERKVDFLDYFRKDSPTRVTEKVMREKLTGTYPVYILVEGNVQDPYVLNTMRETATFLENFPEIRHTQSVADLIERMNDVMGEGMTIPDDEAKIQQLWFLLEGQDIMEQLVSFDLQEGLITANYSSTDTRLISRFVDDAAQYLAVHSSDRYRITIALHEDG